MGMLNKDWADLVCKFQRKSVNPFDFSSFLNLTRTTIEAIKLEWDSLTVEQRNEVIDFVYKLLDHEEENRGVLDRLWTVFYGFLVNLLGQQTNYNLYRGLLDDFIDFVLDAVERETPGHEDWIRSMIEDAFVSSKHSEYIEKGEVYRWLSSVLMD